MAETTPEPGVGDKDEKNAKDAFDQKAVLTEVMKALVAMNARLDKALPPRDAQFQQGKQPKDIDHNATLEEEDNHTSDDATVKPQKVQIRSDPAYMPKGTAGEASPDNIAKALDDRINKAVVELVNARTPEPPAIFKSVAEAKTLGKFVDTWLASHYVQKGPVGSPENFSGGYKFYDRDNDAVKSLYKGMREHVLVKGVRY